METILTMLTTAKADVDAAKIAILGILGVLAVIGIAVAVINRIRT
jgi:NAD/NADP transhydrogenase alpha subunit